MADAAPRSRFGQGFDRLDLLITTSLARVGVPMLRIGLGLVFLWFGALKFFPDLSPAQDLATRTATCCHFGLAVRRSRSRRRLPSGASGPLRPQVNESERAHRLAPPAPAAELRARRADPEPSLARWHPLIAARPS
jgi:hypothetical protein